MVEARKFNNQANPATVADDPYVESLATAINALLSGLPADKLEAVRSKVGALGLAPKPGQVLRAVLKLVPRDRQFTIEDVKKGVELEGVHATAKAIYNALGYLTRKKKITRLGPGLYKLESGEVVITSDELGGEPTKDERHDPN